MQKNLELRSEPMMKKHRKCLLVRLRYSHMEHMCIEFRKQRGRAVV